MPRLVIILVSFLAVAISAVTAQAKAPKCEITFVESQRVSSGFVDSYNVNANGSSVAMIDSSNSIEQLAALKKLIESQQCAPFHARCEFRIGGGNGSANGWTSHYFVTTSESSTLFMNWDITTTNDNLDSNETREAREIRKQASVLKDAGICDQIHVLN